MLGWVAVGVVWGTKQDGAVPGYALYQHSRELQLCIGAVVGVLYHVMMGKGVVADSVPGFIHLPHKGQVLLHLQTYHEECCRYVVFLQNTEHLRGPFAVGTVIEGDNEVFGVAMTDFCHSIVGWQFAVYFIGYKSVVLVFHDGYVARLRFRLHLQHLSVAHEVHVVQTSYLEQLLQVPVGGVFVTHVLAVVVPYTGIFCAQSPHAESGKMVFCPEAHDIIGCGGISEINLMELVVVIYI